MRQRDYKINFETFLVVIETTYPYPLSDRILIELKFKVSYNLVFFFFFL